MIVYFDTVRRKRPIREGGELVQLDWETKKVRKKIPIFPTAPDIDHDPNPRGNTRGGKGILVTEQEVFVGTYHTILVFDHELNLLRKVANNLFVNIHEMCFAGQNIWVSATTIDCAILVDPNGNTIKTFWPREEKVLQERFALAPMTIDKTADNRLAYIHAELSTKESHTHLNAVVKSGAQTYILLNRQGAVVRIEPDVKVIIEDAALKGAHSPRISPDGEQMILCSSFTKSVLFFSIKTGKLLKKIDLLGFAEVAKLQQDHPDQPYNKSIFVRGLDILDEGRILVGISPASILEIDTDKDKLLDFYRYTTDVGDAVHGLAHILNTRN